MPQPIRIGIIGAGGIVKHRHLPGFRKIDGVWVPQHIQLTRPQRKERLTVWYSQIALNQRLTLEAFSYNVPENAKRKRLIRKQED